MEGGYLKRRGGKRLWKILLFFKKLPIWSIIPGGGFAVGLE